MGNKFKTGDLFVSYRGGGCSSDGAPYNTYSIFEYREGNENGLGFAYNIDGDSYSYYWARPSDGCKLLDISDEIMFSFKHGSSDFNVDRDLVKDDSTADELLKMSNFKMVSEESVEKAKFVSSKKTIEDIAENWDKIMEYGYTYNIAKTCMDYVGANFGGVVNGEIGIYAMTVMGVFEEGKDVIKDLIFEKLAKVRENTK